MIYRDLEKIANLRRHCDMYIYASRTIPQLSFSDIAIDLYSFTILHLVCTMFITTDTKKDVTGGVFHRILDPMGNSHLLANIDHVLNRPIGNTNLRRYFRSKRNKLAAHGTLEFTTQPNSVQDVTFDEVSQNQFYSAMEEFDQAIIDLERDLATLESQCEESRKGL